MQIFYGFNLKLFKLFYINCIFELLNMKNDQNGVCTCFPEPLPVFLNPVPVSFLHILLVGNAAQWFLLNFYFNLMAKHGKKRL